LLALFFLRVGFFLAIGKVYQTGPSKVSWRQTSITTPTAASGLNTAHHAGQNLFSKAMGWLTRSSVSLR
jgi:hypothetical protein